MGKYVIQHMHPLCNILREILNVFVLVTWCSKLTSEKQFIRLPSGLSLTSDLLPVVGGDSPQSVFINVVFPAPLWPRRAVIWPSYMSNPRPDVVSKRLHSVHCSHAIGSTVHDVSLHRQVWVLIFKVKSILKLVQLSVIALLHPY